MTGAAWHLTNSLNSGGYMYAIIRTGGKQYTVKPGDVLRVEKLDGELGSELVLTDVLLVGGDKTYVGAPLVASAKVAVVITNQQRGPKLIIFKKKRRQGYRRTGGHRQHYTELFIKAITSPEGQTAKADSEAQVYNPEKKAQQRAKTLEVMQKAKDARRTAGEGAVTAAPKAAKKKSPRKPRAKKPALKKARRKSQRRRKPPKKRQRRTRVFHGIKEGSRLYKERSRFKKQAAGREAIRRPKR